MSNTMIDNKEVVEGNRLIAEFMGGEYLKEKHPLYDSDIESYTFRGGQGNWRLSKDPAKHRCLVHNLFYHLDWSWLMPVVEKISKIPLPGDGARPAEPHETFYPRTFGMLNESGKPMVRINANTLFEADTLIEATWFAVVDFITWYNSITSKKEGE